MTPPREKRVRESVCAISDIILRLIPLCTRNQTIITNPSSIILWFRMRLKGVDGMRLINNITVDAEMHCSMDGISSISINNPPPLITPPPLFCLKSWYLVK